MQPLERLAASLRASARISDRCRALYDYLCELSIADQLSKRASEELAVGQRRAASETLRLYRFMTDALTTLCTVLPDTEMSIDEMIAALSILFSGINISSVPNTHDCVMIGSASTFRVENIKASLLLGLCEGEFPRAFSDDGILTESDKEVLESAGIILDSRAKLRSSEELLYVYRAMTKPTEILCLSTVASQVDGSARTPSLAFSRVCYLMDRKPDRFDSAAIQKALERPAYTGSTPQLKAPIFEVGQTLRLSQSKIRTFVLCPFSYFCIYQLKLREKKDSRPSYSDDGIFLHYVFEKFLRASLGKDGKLHIPPEEEIEPLANRIVDEYLTEVCPLPPDRMEARLLHLFARLRKLSLIMLHEILGELRMSDFVPTKFEQVIGMPGDEGLPPVILKLQNGSRVQLSGMVDRIDMLEKDGKVFVRVIDYKSGTHKFSLDEVRSGMDIQLVLYLFAVLSSDPGKYIPGGAQYLYAKNEKGKVEINRSGFLLQDQQMLECADRSEGSVYTKKLILQTQEEILELTREMNEAICGIANRILSGEADKTPSEEACMFCPVRGICDKTFQKGKE